MPKFRLKANWHCPACGAARRLYPKELLDYQQNKRVCKRCRMEKILLTKRMEKKDERRPL